MAATRHPSIAEQTVDALGGPRSVFALQRRDHERLDEPSAQERRP